MAVDGAKIMRASLEQLAVCGTDHTCDRCGEPIPRGEYAYFWGGEVWCCPCDEKREI